MDGKDNGENLDEANTQKEFRIKPDSDERVRWRSYVAIVFSSAVLAALFLFLFYSDPRYAEFELIDREINRLKNTTAENSRLADRVDVLEKEVERLRNSASSQ